MTPEEIARSLPANYRKAILAMTNEEAVIAIVQLPSGKYITNEPLAAVRAVLEKQDG